VLRHFQRGRRQCHGSHRELWSSHFLIGPIPAQGGKWRHGSILFYRNTWNTCRIETDQRHSTRDLLRNIVKILKRITIYCTYIFSSLYGVEEKTTFPLSFAERSTEAQQRTTATDEPTGEPTGLGDGGASYSVPLLNYIIIL
jgi:hypothetical protein